MKRLIVLTAVSLAIYFGGSLLLLPRELRELLFVFTGWPQSSNDPLILMQLMVAAALLAWLIVCLMAAATTALFCDAILFRRERLRG